MGHPPGPLRWRLAGHDPRPGADSAGKQRHPPGSRRPDCPRRAHCGAVLVWTGGDEWDNRGTRAFLDLVNRGLRNPAQAINRLQERLTDAQTRFRRAQSLLADLRSLAGRNWLSPDPADMPDARDAVADELFRRQSLIEDQLQRARLEPASASSLPALQTQKQEFALATDIVRSGTPRPPSPALLSRIQAAMDDASGHWTREAARLAAQAAALDNWPDIRAAMPQRDPLLLLSIALSAGSDRPLNFGLLSRSFYSSGLDITGAMSPFAQSFRRYGADCPAFLAESMESTYALESLLPIRLGFSSDAAIADGLPAAAAATLLDPDSRFDLPDDTPDRLNWPALSRQEESLFRILLGSGNATGMLTDPLLYGRVDLPIQVSDQDLTLYERAAGEARPTSQSRRHPHRR